MVRAKVKVRLRRREDKAPRERGQAVYNSVFAPLCRKCFPESSAATAMASVRIVAAAFLAVILVILGGCEAAPDSAGMVEMVNGLAYGNIPYGSVSGNLGNYVPVRGRASEYVADPRAPPAIPVGY